MYVERRKSLEGGGGEKYYLPNLTENTQQTTILGNVLTAGAGFDEASAGFDEATRDGARFDGGRTWRYFAERFLFAECQIVSCQVIFLYTR